MLDGHKLHGKFCSFDKNLPTIRLEEPKLGAHVGHSEVEIEKKKRRTKYEVIRDGCQGNDIIVLSNRTKVYSLFVFSKVRFIFFSS